MNPTQVGSDVRDDQNLRFRQGNQTAHWSQKCFDFLSSTTGVQFVHGDGDIDQFVVAHDKFVADLQQCIGIDIGNQAGRNPVVPVQDDQEIVLLNHGIPLTQQVTIHHVQRLLGRIYVVVDMTECAWRNCCQVQSQVGSVGKHLQHLIPRGIAKVECEFFNQLPFARHNAATETGDGLLSGRRLIHGGPRCVTLWRIPACRIGSFSDRFFLWFWCLRQFLFKPRLLIRRQHGGKFRPPLLIERVPFFFGRIKAQCT